MQLKVGERGGILSVSLIQDDCSSVNEGLKTIHKMKRADRHYVDVTSRPREAAECDSQGKAKGGCVDSLDWQRHARAPGTLRPMFSKIQGGSHLLVLFRACCYTSDTLFRGAVIPKAKHQIWYKLYLWLAGSSRRSLRPSCHHNPFS
jgi:hypothetical protein